MAWPVSSGLIHECKGATLVKGRKMNPGLLSLSKLRCHSGHIGMALSMCLDGRLRSDLNDFHNRVVMRVACGFCQRVWSKRVNKLSALRVPRYCTVACVGTIRHLYHDSHSNLSLKHGVVVCFFRRLLPRLDRIVSRCSGSPLRAAASSRYCHPSLTGIDLVWFKANRKNILPTPLCEVVRL